MPIRRKCIAQDSLSLHSSQERWICVGLCLPCNFTSLAFCSDGGRDAGMCTEQNPVNAVQLKSAEGCACERVWRWVANNARARCRLTQIFSRRVIADKGDLHAQLAAACPASRFIYSKHTHTRRRRVLRALSPNLRRCWELQPANVPRVIAFYSFINNHLQQWP